MFSFLKSLSGVAIILTVLLFHNVLSFAGEISTHPKCFDSCTRVTDNRYRCTLDKATNAARIKGYSCKGDTCILQYDPMDKPKQGKGTGYVKLYGYSDMPYALCSKSECTIDKKHPNKAICNCPIVNTKDDISSVSLGMNNRKKSLPKYDAKGNMVKITSTFSMINVFDFKDQLKTLDDITVCKYGQEHSYTDCFAVVCDVDKQNTLNAVCRCPIKRADSFVSVSGKCNTCPDKLYCGVDTSQYQLEGISILYRHFGGMQDVGGR